MTDIIVQIADAPASIVVVQDGFDYFVEQIEESNFVIFETMPANTVVIEEQVPNFIVELAGEIVFGTISGNVRTESANFTTDPGDQYLRCTAPLTVQLEPSTVGREITVKNKTVGDGDIVIAADVGDIYGVEGDPSIILNKSGASLSLKGVVGGWEIW